MEKSEGVKKIKSLAHCDQHLFLIWDSSINCISQYEYFKAGGYTFKARRMHTMYAVRYGKCGKDQFSANSQDYFRFLWNYASIRVIF